MPASVYTVITICIASIVNAKYDIFTGCTLAVLDRTFATEHGFAHFYLLREWHKILDVTIMNSFSKYFKVSTDG